MTTKGQWESPLNLKQVQEGFALDHEFQALVDQASKGEGIGEAVAKYRAHGGSDADLALVVEWTGPENPGIQVASAKARTISRTSLRDMVPEAERPALERWIAGMAPALVTPPVQGRSLLWLSVGATPPKARGESD